MTAKRYLAIVALLTASLAVAAIALCHHVDPYGLDAGDRSEHAERAGAFWRKAYSVYQVMPRTVVLGTSRANSGLNAGHPAFMADDAPAANLALGAARIDQIYLLLIHANTVSRVRKAVIGLDIESFLGGGRTDFQAAALAGNPHSQPVWLSRLLVYFSPAALGASVSRLIAPEWMLSRADPETILNELGGLRGVVWITEFNNFYSRLPRLFPPAATAAQWDNDPRRRAAMESFRQLLEYAAENEIELRLFISPVHARYLEWYRRVGWWPLFQDWKRELVSSIASQRASSGTGSAVTLWDLSGFHSAATESVPALGDLETRMQWYQESSHYSRALGDRILSLTVAGRADDALPLPDARIDRRNIERHLSQQTFDAEGWRAAQPGEAENVRQMANYLRRIGRK